MAGGLLPVRYPEELDPHGIRLVGNLRPLILAEIHLHIKIVPHEPFISAFGLLKVNALHMQVVNPQNFHRILPYSNESRAISAAPAWSVLSPHP